MCRSSLVVQGLWLSFHLHRLRNDSLAECVPPFHLLKYESVGITALFYRNIITRMPGTSWITHRPREKFELVDFQFSNDNHKHPEITPSKLSTVLCSFPITHLPRNIVTLSSTSTFLHQPPSPKSLWEFTAIMPYHRQNQCQWWRTFPCFFCYSGSEPMQCRWLRFLVHPTCVNDKGGKLTKSESLICPSAFTKPNILLSFPQWMQCRLYIRYGPPH